MVRKHLQSGFPRSFQLSLYWNGFGVVCCGCIMVKGGDMGGFHVGGGKLGERYRCEVVIRCQPVYTLKRVVSFYIVSFLFLCFLALMKFLTRYFVTLY